MQIKYILGIVTLVLFFVFFLTGKQPRKSYLLFVLCFLPFLDLSITSENYGSFTIFDALSYFSFFYLVNDFNLYKYNSFYSFLFLILVVLVFIGSVRSDFVQSSILNLLKFISIFIFAKLLVEECRDNPPFFRMAINGLKFSCLFAIAFLLIQMVIGLKFTFYTELNPNIADSIVTRYPGFFQDPQMFAQFLSMTSFLFLIKKDGHTKINAINYLVFAVIVAALFITGGRSAFLGMCMGLFILLLFSKKQLAFMVLGACLALYFAIVKYPQFFSLFNRQESSMEAYEVRYGIWKEAFTVFKENPFFGTGIGNYLSYIAKHSQDGYYIINDEVVYYGTESGYLRILTEMGVAGFVLAFSFVISPLISGLKWCSKGINNSIVVFLIASIVSWMTAFTTLNTLSDKRTQIVLATLLSLVVVATYDYKKSNA